MKVALVYDRVNKWGGAEKVLLALHDMFPEAPLYTAVFNAKKASWASVFPKVIPSFLQRLPILNNFHEMLGIFTPIAFESFDFNGYDLVISVTSEAAKGIITRPCTKHICYCLTPTRYLWSDYDFYLKSPQWPLNLVPFYTHVSRPFLSYVKRWDCLAAQRPDVMIAISKAVELRIKKFYNRDSIVIYPPVDIEKYQVSSIKYQKKNDYFLIVSRLVPYKRVDLAILAFNQLGYPLKIVGTGSQEKRLKRLASDNIEFVGFIPDEKLVKYYQNARALIMPQVEDFGIIAVEAQAAGCPVIAYQKGGALDAVIDGKTGVFFKSQNIESLVDGVKRFAKMEFNTQNLVNNAKSFSKDKFKREFLEVIK